MIRTFDDLGFCDAWLYGGWLFAKFYGWERHWHYRTFEVATDYAAYPASRGPYFQKAERKP